MRAAPRCASENAAIARWRPWVRVARRRPRLAAGVGGRPAGDRPSILLSSLLAEHEVRAAILLPALLVRLVAERLFLAIADGLDAVGADAGLHQRVLHRVGAVVA